MAKADWTKIKLAYINSSKSLRKVAAEFKTSPAGVMRRAAKEGWEQERQQKSAKVSKEAQEVITVDRVAELARFNEDDLKIARAIRVKAFQALQVVQSPAELRMAASAFEAAQRIGRLALGASTDNQIVTGADGGPIQTVTRIELVPMAGNDDGKD